MWRGLFAAFLASPLAVAARVSVPFEIDASISAFSPTKVFTLQITWKQYAPLGISRKLLLVNGQTPGPELQFDQGDNVAVHVANDSPFNTTIHFHGTITTLDSTFPDTDSIEAWKCRTPLGRTAYRE